MDQVAGIVLAAGSSRRFGRPKQLLKLGGETFVGRVVAVATEAGVSPLTVVTRDELRSEMVHALGAHAVAAPIVVNPRPDDGLGSSLRVGALAVPDDVDAVVILLADQPLVTADLIEALVSAWRHGRGRIVRPVSGSVMGHPVLLDACFLPELRELPPEHAGRHVVAAHEDELHTISVADADCLLDVDTPDDYMRLLRVSWRGDGSGSR